ncbi:hypothetical protein Dimus_024319 [Dionaea muscipula]
MASPPKKKQKKLTQWEEAMVTTGSDVEDKGKEVVKEPEANLTVAPKLYHETGKKTIGKGKKARDGKSGQGKLLPSLQLPPSILPTGPSVPSSTIPQRQGPASLSHPHWCSSACRSNSLLVLIGWPAMYGLRR